MHSNSSLLRSLLASAIALTLDSRAAVVDRRSGCGDHYGWLQLGLSTDDLVHGWIKTVATGADFGTVSSDATAGRATFRYNDCGPGANYAVRVYCMSCDTWDADPSTADIQNLPMAAFRNTGALGPYAGNFAYQEWIMYNAGVDPSWFAFDSQADTNHLAWFTWDEEGFMHPQTTNAQGTEWQLFDAEYYPASGQLGFLPGIGPPSKYNTLLWVDLPQ